MIAERKKHGVLRVETARYALEIRLEHAVALLDVKRSHQRYMFFPGGACNTTHKRDGTVSFGRPSLRSQTGQCMIELPEQSSLWTRKTGCFVCREHSIEYFYTLEGRGKVDRALFFRGYHAGEERGFAGNFDEIYNTAPNHQERLYYHPAESFFISFGNNPTGSAGGQAMASPCQCMGLHDRRDRDYVSVGLAARPGGYTWDAMEWNPPVAIPATPFPPDSMVAGGFAATYEGRLRVDGTWESPRLILTFARGQQEVLPSYLKHCYRHGYLPRPRRRRRVQWWHEPIYCTWHDQVAMAGAVTDRDGKGGRLPAMALCTQELADRWLSMLEKKGCKPGTVILDATWQKHLNTAEADTKKWPDLRGWIERCHATGVRVFVWTAAWSTGGLPRRECITRDGEPVACDITHPDYQRRFRRMVRGWFSDAPDCLNADGVKLDGLLSLPTGKGLRNRGNLWGLELQRQYLQVLYDEAKKHKRDACVSTYVANPYLAPFSDMVRIGDMYTTRLTPHETMLHRAEVYTQTMPYAVIDTDGQFCHYVLDDYANELTEQAKIGVPTLYTAERVFRQRFYLPAFNTQLTQTDYEEFARVFAAYRSKIRAGKRTPGHGARKA